LGVSTAAKPSIGPFGSKEPMPKRVMIYRLGSIGDTVIALPCFKFIRQCFPAAHLSLLTNNPRRGEAPVLSVIGTMGLIDRTFLYDAGERGPLALWKLRGEIRAERPDLIIYLSAYRGILSLVRDIIFLRLAGARRILGAPFAADMRAPRKEGPNGEYEPEAARLARCLAPLGDVDLTDPGALDLEFTKEENDFARETLDAALLDTPFVAAAVGAKIPAKDWGEESWSTALGEMGRALGDHALVMIGGPDDWERSERIVHAWNGPGLNLCGKASPRQSAAVMAKASIFVGSDGGPMHLAAAAGTRCCAIFGPYNRPRRWHPLGIGHRITHVNDMKDADPYDFSRGVIEMVTTAHS
jgi:heptosyltransferase III